MTDTSAGKQAAARAALEFVGDDAVIGVGTGSTVNFFIDALAAHRGRIRGAVSSSEASTARLKAVGIEVLDLNRTGDLEVYVDGADETDHHRRLIKGGGAALTREKIVAAASCKFVCVVDESKVVDVLGRFPLPVEVIPMAAELVGARLRILGGTPVPRKGFLTDNGNVILDVAGLVIEDAATLESEINQWAGVVTVGLFARQPASVALVATPEGVREMLG